MSLLKRHGWQYELARELDRSGRTPAFARVVDEEPLTRHEPQAFAYHEVAQDPYAAWLQRREARRQAECVPVRWVSCGPRSSGATTGAARGHAPQVAPTGEVAVAPAQALVGVA